MKKIGYLILGERPTTEYEILEGNNVIEVGGILYEIEIKCTQVKEEGLETGSVSVQSDFTPSPSTVEPELPATVPVCLDLPTTIIPVDSELPATIPVGSDLPATIPVGSDLPATIPYDSDLSATIPVDSDLPATIPVGSDLPATIPVGSDLPATIPVGSDLPATIPYDSDLPATIPYDSDLSATIPVDSDLPATIPVGSDLPATIPVDTDLPATIPVGSDLPATIPVGSDLPATIPVGSDLPATIPFDADLPATVPVDIPATIPDDSLSANIPDFDKFESATQYDDDQATQIDDDYLPDVGMSEEIPATISDRSEFEATQLDEDELLTTSSSNSNKSIDPFNEPTQALDDDLAPTLLVDEGGDPMDEEEISPTVADEEEVSATIIDPGSKEDEQQTAPADDDSLMMTQLQDDEELPTGEELPPTIADDSMMTFLSENDSDQEEEEDDEDSPPTPLPDDDELPSTVVDELPSTLVDELPSTIISDDLPLTAMVDEPLGSNFLPSKEKKNVETTQFEDDISPTIPDSTLFVPQESIQQLEDSDLSATMPDSTIFLPQESELPSTVVDEGQLIPEDVSEDFDDDDEQTVELPATMIEEELPPTIIEECDIPSAMNHDATGELPAGEENLEPTLVEDADLSACLPEEEEEEDSFESNESKNPLEEGGDLEMTLLIDDHGVGSDNEIPATILEDDDLFDDQSQESETIPTATDTPKPLTPEPTTTTEPIFEPEKPLTPGSKMLSQEESPSSPSVRFDFSQLDGRLEFSYFSTPSSQQLSKSNQSFKVPNSSSSSSLSSPSLPKTPDDILLKSGPIYNFASLDGVLTFPSDQSQDTSLKLESPSEKEQGDTFKFATNGKDDDESPKRGSSVMYYPNESFKLPEDEKSESKLVLFSQFDTFDTEIGDDLRNTTEELDISLSKTTKEDDKLDMSQERESHEGKIRKREEEVFEEDEEKSKKRRKIGDEDVVTQEDSVMETEEEPPSIRDSRGFSPEIGDSGILRDDRPLELLSKDQKSILAGLSESDDFDDETIENKSERKRKRSDDESNSNFEKKRVKKSSSSSSSACLSFTPPNVSLLHSIDTTPGSDAQSTPSSIAMNPGELSLSHLGKSEESPQAQEGTGQKTSSPTHSQSLTLSFHESQIQSDSQTQPLSQTGSQSQPESQEIEEEEQKKKGGRASSRRGGGGGGRLTRKGRASGGRKLRSSESNQSQEEEKKESPMNCSSEETFTFTSGVSPQSTSSGGRKTRRSGGSGGPVEVTSSGRVVKHVRKHSIYISSHAPDRRKLEAHIRRLNGRVSDKVQNSTELVVHEIRRTSNFLYAMAMGIPIVSCEWVDDCFKADRWLDGMEHLIVDPEGEEKFGFNLKKSLEKSQQQKLFEGMEFYFKLPSKKKDKETDELKQVVVLAGGVCLKKMPTKSSPKFICVSAKADGIPAKFLSQAFEPEFVKISIMRQEINLLENRLVPP